MRLFRCFPLLFVLCWLAGSAPVARAGCESPTLAAPEFNRLLAELNSLSFESARVSMAEALLRHHCLSSDQVRQLLASFQYEATRLRLAKQAYAHTHDPANYEQLIDRSLSKPAHRRALQDYVRRHDAGPPPWEIQGPACCR